MEFIFLELLLNLSETSIDEIVHFKQKNDQSQKIESRV